MSFVASNLRQKRFKIISDAQNLINSENADADVMQTFDAMMAEADTIMEQVTRVEKASAQAASFDEIIGASAERSHVSVGQKANELDTFKNGFVAMLRANANIALSPKDKTALEDFRAAASVGTNSAGGFTVPIELMREIFAAMVLEGGMRAAGAKIMSTATGGNLDIPLNNDTANVASLVGEGASLGTATDLVFSKVTLSAYKFTSGVALVSKELLQDSAFSFDQFLTEQLTHRFVRGTNAYYVSGTGSSQPQGIVTAASSGIVGATGQTTSILYTDLVGMEHSIAYPYRRNAHWLMSDGSFRSIKRLVDTVGRPLWVPGLSVGAPETILGYPVTLSADIATPAANAKSLLFGDFSNFIIRDVLDLSFQVLNELYAASGQVGIVGIMRTDSRFATLGNAVTYYTNSAT